MNRFYIQVKRDCGKLHQSNGLDSELQMGNHHTKGEATPHCLAFQTSQGRLAPLAGPCAFTSMGMLV